MFNQATSRSELTSRIDLTVAGLLVVRLRLYFLPDCNWKRNSFRLEYVLKS